MLGKAFGYMASATAYGAARTGGLASDIFGIANRGAYGMVGASSTAQRAVAGGALGGAYGAFADDTSMLGGAAMGAGMGAASVSAGRGLGRGYNTYKRLRGLSGVNIGRGQAGWAATVGAGQDSKKFIGNTMSKAYGSFRSTMKNWGQL